MSPHAGLGAGPVFVDLFFHRIHDTFSDADNARKKETVHAQGVSAAWGPIGGELYDGHFFLNGRVYSGEKRLAVEEWGALVANTVDLYKGGWKAGAAWVGKNASFSLSYGADKLEAYYGALVGTVNYTAAVLVGSVNWRFTY